MFTVSSRKVFYLQQPYPMIPPISELTVTNLMNLQELTNGSQTSSKSLPEGKEKKRSYIFFTSLVKAGECKSSPEGVPGFGLLRQLSRHAALHLLAH